MGPNQLMLHLSPTMMLQSPTNPKCRTTWTTTHILRVFPLSTVTLAMLCIIFHTTATSQFIMRVLHTHPLYLTTLEQLICLCQEHMSSLNQHLFLIQHFLPIQVSFPSRRSYRNLRSPAFYPNKIFFPTYLHS